MDSLNNKPKVTGTIPGKKRSTSVKDEVQDIAFQSVDRIRNLSHELSELKDEANRNIRLVYIFAGLSLFFGIMLGINSYSTTHKNTKYIRVGPNGLLGEIPIYKKPYLSEIDRINFAQRIVMNMSSIGWLNRERVLTDMKSLFAPSVFNEFVTTLESDALFNRKSMRKYHTSVAGSIVQPGRILDDNAKVKGVNSKYNAEKIEFGVVQDVSQNGVVVSKLRSIVRLIIVRQDQNIYPYGYLVVSYIVKQAK
ncbi:MAG: DotI/IcmL/TraM family protein [Pseudomonadota bacterium]